MMPNIIRVFIHPSQCPIVIQALKTGLNDIGRIKAADHRATANIQGQAGKARLNSQGKASPNMSAVMAPVTRPKALNSFLLC